MLNKLLISLLFVLGASAAYAQYYPITEYCKKGATPAATSGLPSSNTLQGIVPGCLVTVYLTGTTTTASIFSNATGTVLTNPFTANVTSGQWIFYAAAGQQYDIKLSGGNPPNFYQTPTTLVAISPSSGGTVPAAPKYAVQYSNSSVTGLLSDASTLNAYLVSTANNGLSMSVAECQTYSYACQVLAPALYAVTEVQPWGGAWGWGGQSRSWNGGGPANVSANTAPQGCVEDQRFGGPEWICTPVTQPPWYTADGSGDFLAGPSFTMQETHLGTGANPSGTPALQINENNFYGGFNYTGFQSTLSALRMRETQYAPGSVNMEESVLFGQAAGDKIGKYLWVYCQGGITATDNEGCIGSRESLLEYGQELQGTITSITSVASPAAGSPCKGPCNIFGVTVTAPTYGSYWGDQRPDIDITKAYSTGYIANITTGGELTGAGTNWDSTFGVSNAYGTLPGGLPIGTNVTVSVSTTFGTWNTTSPVCVSDHTGRMSENEKVTAASGSSITFALSQFNYEAGAVVAQGGMACMVAEMVADEVTSSTPNITIDPENPPVGTVRHSVPIMYNVTGNSLYMISGNQFELGAFGTRAYQQMGSGGSVTATLSGGAVASCAASGGTGYSPQMDVNGYMFNPPQLTYAVNGGATPPHLILTNGGAGGALSGCLVDPLAPGSGITALTVTVTPTNSYAVYPAARNFNVWNPATGNVDGSSIATDIPSGAGSYVFQMGDTIEQEPYYTNIYTADRRHISQYQTNVPQVGWNLALYGIVDGGAASIQNYTSPTFYTGYPGLSTPWVPGQSQQFTGPPGGLGLSGPFSSGLGMSMPPPPSGAVVSVGCTDAHLNDVCGGWSVPYSLLSLSYEGGGADTVTYTPEGANARTLAFNFGGQSLAISPSGSTATNFSLTSSGGMVSGLFTQYLPYSNNPQGATWTLTGGSGTMTYTPGQLDQNGGNSATLMNFTGGSLYFLTDEATGGYTSLTPGSRYALTVWLKGGTALMDFTMGTGLAHGSFTPPGTWQSYCIAGSAAASFPNYLMTLNFNSTGTVTFGGATLVANGTCPASTVVVTTNNQILTPAAVNSTPSLAITGIAASTPVLGLDSNQKIIAATGDSAYQNPIALTTTGASGAATFVGDVLNIPNYSAGYNLYSTTGTTITSPHQVIYSGTMTGGALAVTLSGSAIFTSSSSYSCTAADTTTPGTAAAAGTYTDGSHFTVTGTGTDAVRGICTGN